MEKSLEKDRIAKEQSTQRAMSLRNQYLVLVCYYFSQCTVCGKITGGATALVHPQDFLLIACEKTRTPTHVEAIFIGSSDMSKEDFSKVSCTDSLKSISFGMFLMTSLLFPVLESEGRGDVLFVGRCRLAVFKVPSNFLLWSRYCQ